MYGQGGLREKKKKETSFSSGGSVGGKIVLYNEVNVGTSIAGED